MPPFQGPIAQGTSESFFRATGRTGGISDNSVSTKRTPVSGSGGGGSSSQSSQASSQQASPSFESQLSSGETQALQKVKNEQPLSPVDLFNLKKLAGREGFGTRGTVGGVKTANLTDVIQFTTQRFESERQAVEQDKRQQRQSLVARNSGITQFNRPTPNNIREEGMTTTPPRLNIKNVANEFVRNPKSIYGTVAGVTKRLFNKVTDKEGREIATREETEKLRSGTRERPFVASGRGTIVTENIKYTNKEIVTLGEEGRVSETAVLNELGRREAEKYGHGREQYLKTQLPEIKANAEAEMELIYNRLNKQVQNKEITVDEANKILQKERDRINEGINKEVGKRAEDWHESTGIKIEKDSYIYLNKVSDKIKISKYSRVAPLIIGAGIATGGAATLIAGTGATAAAAVTAAGVVGGGAAAYGTVNSLIRSGKEGTLNSGRVAAVLVPQILFGAGAYAGSRLASNIETSQSRTIRAALETSTIKTDGTPKILTTEKSIELLKISEDQKLNLINELRGGNSVAIQKFKIGNRNPKYRKVIDEFIPNREIVRVGTYDNVNRGILGQDITRISLGGNKFKYVELQTGLSAGRVGSEGVGVIDTLYTRSSGKGTFEVGKTRTGFKTGQTLIKDPISSEVLGRKLTSDSLIYQGKKININSKNQLSYNDLINLAESSSFNKRPSSKSSKNEVQRIINKEREIKLIEDDLILDVKKVKLKTVKVDDSTGLIPKDITYRFSRRSKPFSETGTTENVLNVKPPKNEVLNVKPPKNELLNVKSLQSEFAGTGKYELTNEISFLKSSDFTGNILRSVREIGEVKLSKLPKPSIKDARINPLSQYMVNLNNELNKQDNKFGLLNKQLVSYKSDEIPKNKFNSNLGQLQSSSQAQNYKQISTQINQLINTSPFQPFPTVPKIPDVRTPRIPIIPILPSFRRGNANIKKVRKQIRKASAPTFNYAASLAAAAFQVKPVQITRKQFEKLKKRQVVTTAANPVIEIVDRDNLNKSIKNSVQF